MIRSLDFNLTFISEGDLYHIMDKIIIEYLQLIFRFL